MCEGTRSKHQIGGVRPRDDTGATQRASNRWGWEAEILRVALDSPSGALPVAGESESIPQIQDLIGPNRSKEDGLAALVLADAVDSFVEIGGFAIFVQQSWRIHNSNMAIYQQTGLHSVSRPRFECREGSMNPLVVTAPHARFCRRKSRLRANETTAFSGLHDC